MVLSRFSIALTICISGLLVLESCHAQDSPRDFLNAHNQARAEVGVGPLVWDETVAAYARNYANKRWGDCSLIHSGGPYGENLAWGSRDLSAAAAVRMWVAEKSIYDYSSNKCIGDPWGCLHYTQVVWRKSTRLGCAKVRCNSGGTFIICNYNPPGNYNGEWPYEILAMKV